MRSISYDKQSIRRAAYSMIANHGAYAKLVAAKRARNLTDDQSLEARVTWTRIIEVIEEIQSEPVRVAH